MGRGGTQRRPCQVCLPNSEIPVNFEIWSDLKRVTRAFWRSQGGH